MLKTPTTLNRCGLLLNIPEWMLYLSSSVKLNFDPISSLRAWMKSVTVYIHSFNRIRYKLNQSQHAQHGENYNCRTEFSWELCIYNIVAKSEYESKLTRDFASTNNSKSTDTSIAICTSAVVAFPLQCALIQLQPHAMEKANLCIYFHSFSTKSTFVIPPLDDMPKPVSSLDQIHIEDCDVYDDILISLDSTKAMGIDGIGYRILKHCAIALYKPLTRHI